MNSSEKTQVTTMRNISGRYNTENVVEKKIGSFQGLKKSDFFNLTYYKYF